MPDTYLINGTDLRSAAWRIETAEGLQDSPDQRGDDIVIPQMHGALDLAADPSAPRRRYGPGSIKFSMWVLGVDPVTGIGASSPDDLSLYLARLGTLQRLFAARTLSILHPRPDGNRRCVARLAAPLKPVREPSSPWFGRLVADCTIPGAFWRSESAVTASATVATGGSVPLSVFGSSDAPITDALLTFGPGSNPLLTLGGSYFRYNGVIAAGRQLTVDCATWQLGYGTGAVWSPSVANVEAVPGPSFFEIDAASSAGGTPAAVLAHTGGGSMSVSITAKQANLSS